MLYLHQGTYHSFTEQSAPYQALNVPKQTLHQTAARHAAVSVRSIQPMNLLFVSGSFEASAHPVRGAAKTH